MTSILSYFLDACSVKHTKTYANNLYFSHPNRNNMLGLKQMLDSYGIKTEGVKYENKHNAELVFPCILHFPGSFVIGMDLKGDSISYLYNGHEIQKNVEDFCNVWTGHALLPIGNVKEVIEPDYYVRRQEENVKRTTSILLLLSLLSVWGLYYVLSTSNSFFHNVYGIIFDWMGLLLSYCLIEKQLFHVSRYGDKVCSLFHLNNCNDVLSSEKSKIGIFSWSEIGFGYFAGRLICRAFLPYSLLPLAIVGWGAMLYGIWSIWQQMFKLHQLCVLCSLVQVVVWMNGIIDIWCFSGQVSNISEISYNALLVFCLISASVLCTYKVVSLNRSKIELQKELWDLKAFKTDPEIFLTKLHKGEFYETTDDDSHVLFGKKDSQIRITILTNPHCNPCAHMHKRVEALLNIYGDRLCVQYIFSSFNEKLEDSSRFLISSYLQLEKEFSKTIFKQWYNGKNAKARTFIQQTPVDIHSSETDSEMTRNKKWLERTGFTATPTILVNGYTLPEGYEIEDVPYLL